MTLPRAAKRIGRIALVGAVAAAMLAGGCTDNITDSDIKMMPVTEVRKLTLRQAAEPKSKLIVLIDPRAAARYDAGHLPGARNLKLPQIPELGSVDPALQAYDHIVVYGTDPGSAAARAMTKRLIKVGYSDVRMFAGGVSEWVEKGYTLQTTTKPEPQPATVAPFDTDPASP